MPEDLHNRTVALGVKVLVSAMVFRTDAAKFDRSEDADAVHDHGVDARQARRGETRGADRRGFRCGVWMVWTARVALGGRSC